MVRLTKDSMALGALDGAQINFFAVRQVCEKLNAEGKYDFLVFMDLKKAMLVDQGAL